MPKRYSQDFGAAVALVIGPRTLREAADLCGLDHSTLGRMRQGKIVQPETVRAFADGMQLRGRARAELFERAGYVPDFEPAGAAQ